MAQSLSLRLMLMPTCPHRTQQRHKLMLILMSQPSPLADKLILCFSAGVASGNCAAISGTHCIINDKFLTSKSARGIPVILWTVITNWIGCICLGNSAVSRGIWNNLNMASAPHSCFGSRWIIRSRFCPNYRSSFINSRHVTFVFWVNNTFHHFSSFTRRILTLHDNLLVKQNIP